ncbi:hypothetical protein AMECASPLE_000356 [Ameca splendens]|uniref:Uncharacterized protein n=1 Tax=Ameca splendens TaxID=208324 RepID=A0ABV0Y8L1_9TELE
MHTYRFLPTAIIHQKKEKKKINNTKKKNSVIWRKRIRVLAVTYCCYSPRHDLHNVGPSTPQKQPACPGTGGQLIRAQSSDVQS